MGYFDKKINRFNTGSYKYDKLKEVYPFLNKDSFVSTLADMDLRTSKEVMKSFKKLSKFGIYGYMTTQYDPFYDSIISYYKIRHNLLINKDEIIYSNGAINSLEAIIGLFTLEKDNIGLSSPVYGHFYESINKLNRNVIDIPLIRKKIEDNLFSYEFNFDLFIKTLKTKKIKVYILCSPVNPIGKVFTKIELNKIISICQEYNCLLISDEVHCDFINSYLDNKFVSIFNAINNKELNLTPYKNIILLNGLGKSFNLAGIQASYMIIKDKELCEFIKKSFDIDINTFTLNAFLSAYSIKGLNYLDKVNKYIDNNYQFILEFIKKELPLLKINKREGTYFIYLDFSSFNLKKEELNDLLINKCNIFLEEGSIFSKSKENELCQRMILTHPKKEIKKAFFKLKEVLNLN